MFQVQIHDRGSTTGKLSSSTFCRWCGARFNATDLCSTISSITATPYALGLPTATVWPLSSSGVTHVISALPAAERLQRVRAERWIGYPRAHDALAKLEQLFTHPTRQRMPNLLLVGPTNNGKTMIIEKLRRLHPSVLREETDAEHLPIVCVQMPSEPTGTRFYALLLYSMHAPPRPGARVDVLETLALRIMRNAGVRMLVINELHNILAGAPTRQREFLALIRFLGNELHIPIVGVGTKEAYLAIRSDDQLENRFEPFVLPLWQENQELASLLASFLAVLPLRRRSDEAVLSLLRYNPG
jgi:hypothetical protein